MFFYYSIWALLCCFSLFFSKKAELKLIFIFFVIFLIIFTGMRYEISGDWYNYIQIYNLFSGVDLITALKITDPAYGLLNYVSQQFGVPDTILVYTICSILFYSFFIVFSKRIENYWIPLLVAFPYLILVVSMGYVRQSVAISCVLFAFLYGLERKYWKLFFFSILAILFHKSAIIILMLYPLFFVQKLFYNRLIFLTYSLVSFVVMSILVYISSISGENIYTNQSGDVSSAGAVFRIIVHFLALFFYAFYRAKIKGKYPRSYRIFDYLSLLILFVLMLSLGFSTLADRFNLYLIMFDIFVFSLLYSELELFNRKFMVSMIIVFNTLMLVIWLNFGAWSGAWLPYQNYLFNYILGSL